MSIYIFLCKCSWPKKIQKHPSVCRRKAQWRIAGGPWLFLIFNTVKCFQVTGWFVPLSSICLNSCSEAWKGTFIWLRKRMFRDLGAMTCLFGNLYWNEHCFAIINDFLVTLLLIWKSKLSKPLYFNVMCCGKPRVLLCCFFHWNTLLWRHNVSVSS